MIKRLNTKKFVLSCRRKLKLKRNMGFSITLEDIENIPKIKVKGRKI